MKHLILITLLAMVLAGCSDPAAPTVAPNVTAQQQASASRSMGLSFPPETRLMFYHRASEERSMVPGPDDAVHLKIELPAPALATFLNQAPLSSAKWTSASSLTDNPKWPQWQPSKIKAFRFQQFELPKAKFLHVLIDDDRNDPKVVYLFWFET